MSEELGQHDTHQQRTEQAAREDEHHQLHRLRDEAGHESDDLHR